MSMRVNRSIELYLSVRETILTNLAAGRRQTVDDVDGIVRACCQEIADANGVGYTTVWAQVTRDMGLTGPELYDILKQHLFAPDKRISRFAHNILSHIGRGDDVTDIRVRLNQ